MDRTGIESGEWRAWSSRCQPYPTRRYAREPEGTGPPAVARPAVAATPSSFAPRAPRLRYWPLFSLRWASASIPTCDHGANGSLRATARVDDAERLEEASTESTVPGEKRLGVSLGVRPHEEAGSHAGPPVAAPSILPPLSGGEVGAVLVDRAEADAGSWQGAPHVADVGEVRADLRQTIGQITIRPKSRGVAGARTDARLWTGWLVRTSRSTELSTAVITRRCLFGRPDRAATPGRVSPRGRRRCRCASGSRPTSLRSGSTGARHLTIRAPSRSSNSSSWPGSSPRLSRRSLGIVT